MALVLADRVRDTTTTTGTGTVTLSGTAPTGYQTFGTAIGNANTTYYTINAGSQWEVGIGTYTAAGTTLSRDTVLASSNAGALVNFSAGTKDVFVTYPAEKSVNQDASGNVGIGTSAPASAFEISRTSTSSIGYSTSTTSTYLSRWTARNTDVSLDLYCSLSALTTGVGDVGTTSNHPLTFTTNNSERMRLDTSGNFAVGTTSANSFRTYVKQSSANQAGLAVAASAATTETRLFNDGTLAGIASSYSGTASFLPLTFWTSDTERMRIDSSGNLGVGTASPTLKADVRGAVGSIGASGTNALVVGDYGATAGTFTITAITGRNLTFNDSYAGAERMRIDSSGSLLVGKTSVSGLGEILGVNRTSDGTTAMIGRNGATNNPYARFIATDTGCITTIDANGSAGTPALALSANSSEIMRLTGGNVGIGTGSPGAKLHVDGVGKGTIFGSSAALNFYSAWRFNSTDIGYVGNGSAVMTGAGVADFGIGATGAINLCLGTNDVERMRITSGGNVGIGTSSPTAISGYTALMLNNATNGSIFDLAQGGTMRGRLVGTTSALGLETSGTIPIAFLPAGVEKMRLTDTGRLGVGTSSPATTFDVNGSSAGNVVAVSASAVDCATGNYFTKTASGALTWTFTNVPASRAFIFALQLTNGGSGTQTWPAAVVWDGGTAPTLQTSGTDILVFVTSDSGTTWRGVRGWKQA